MKREVLEMSRKLRTLVPVVALLAAAPTPGAESPCDALGKALRAAGAERPFAEIIGQDTGLFHETTVQFPGAKLCLVYPEGPPAPSWRCLVGGESRYTQALTGQGELASSVESCLGAGWSREEVDDPAYLELTVFTRSEDGARVRVLATKQFDPPRGWKAYRMVVGVYAPEP
jgi:hypothetical protein